MELNTIPAAGTLGFETLSAATGQVVSDAGLGLLCCSTTLTAASASGGKFCVSTDTRHTSWSEVFLFSKVLNQKSYISIRTSYTSGHTGNNIKPHIQNKEISKEEFQK